MNSSANPDRRSRPEDRAENPESAAGADPAHDLVAKIVRHVITSDSYERSGEPHIETIRALGKNRFLVVCGGNHFLVALESAKNLDDETESGFLSELVNISCTPMGVEMKSVPTGAAGLAEDWRRVGGYLRRAMGNIENVQERKYLVSVQSKGEGRGSDDAPEVGSPRPNDREPSVTSSTAEHGPTEVSPGDLEMRISVIQPGLLPPPDELKRYEEILPGASERIVKMAEKEQQARAEEDDREFRLNRAWTGAALISALMALAVVLYGFHLGYSWEVVPLGLAALLTLVGRKVVKSFRPD